MKIKLQGTNLNLTSELRELVNEKINDSLRALGRVNQESVRGAVELEHTTRRHTQSRENKQLFKAEATVSLPGHTLRVEESAMDIEKAVVKLKHTLTRDLRKWREHLIENRRQGARKIKANLAEDLQPATAGKVDAWVDEWIEQGEETVSETDEKKWDEWEDDGIDDRDAI